MHFLHTFYIIKLCKLIGVKLLICKLADIIVDFVNPSQDMQSFLSGYSYNGTPQFSVSVSPQDIEASRNTLSVTVSHLQGEIAAFLKKLLSVVPDYDAFLLHSALIDVNGTGVAFAALSGTGKTTHLLLWKQLLGDSIRVINGDKPIIRFFDNIPYGFGTPWNGKENLGENAKTPIKHLCFIERSAKNRCTKITAEDCLKKIFSQVFLPNDPIVATKILNLLDCFLKSVTIWKIECNTDISAAATAYNAIFKGEHNET